MDSVRGYEQYALTQGATAGPERLVVLAYDGMIRFLRMAEEAVSRGRYEDQNALIQRVQQILSVLGASLDREVHPQLCNNLSSLYEWFYLQLTEANINSDTQKLVLVRQHLEDLREAWQSAEQDLCTKKAEAGAVGIGEAA